MTKKRQAAEVSFLLESGACCEPAATSATLSNQECYVKTTVCLTVINLTQQQNIKSGRDQELFPGL